MSMEMEYEFKASSVDAAIEKGLKKLKLTRDEVDVEIVNEEGGIFSRAVVKMKLKKPEIKTETEEIEINEPLDTAITDVETAEEIVEHIEVNEEIAEEKPAYEKRERREKRFNDRPRERKEYFSEEKETGKTFIYGIAEHFTNNVRVDAKSYEDEICFYISGEKASAFIGHRGETLDAIQYLAGQVVNKNKEGEHIRVTVDADFYRERRKRTLTALAKKIANNAYDKKQEISLEPMNSYERRIIHSALQNSDIAETRSEGEGKDRHIVIVPKCEVMTYGNVNAEFKKKGPSKTKSYGQKRMKF